MPLAALLLLTLAVPPALLAVGGRKQLFIDEKFIAERERAELWTNLTRGLTAFP